ncbi:MAG: D-alanine aminotransferase, partial [Porticoccaceae bacterium]|nr:D-alanine aminotransferase [Porticoccaceae bacterium]
MSIVFLNGSYMPMSEAKISPLDRGFLFGDSIYEVIPSYQGRLLGFGPHIDRMNDGFKGIGLNMDWSDQQWKMLCEDLADKNGNSNLGIY